MASQDDALTTGMAQVALPKVTIKFCTQCKWNLRAAYYAQELLQTFNTAIGEISLVPVTGGVFTVTILHLPSPVDSAPIAISAGPFNSDEITETLLWDRKTEGGFPETKELKNRVRNVVDPKKDMGHIDRSLKKGKIGVDDGQKKGTTEIQEDGPSQNEPQAKQGGDTQTESHPRQYKGTETETRFNGGIQTQPDAQFQITEDCEDCR